jgi:hypothetical protein
MKALQVAATVALALPLLDAGAQTSSSAPAAAAVPAAGVTVAIEDLKLVPLDMRAPDHFQMAVLWGDPRTGPSAMMLRLVKGDLPLHVHSHDYHLLVVRGTLKHWDEDDAEAAAKPLGPGSYWFQPGRRAHRDACLSDECLVYLNWTGPRDGYRPPPKSN